MLLPQRRRIYRRAIRSGPIAHAMRRLLRPQYRLLLPIQRHHPAQHAPQIDRHIGIAEQTFDNRRGQQRQSQQAPGLRYIDALGSGNISDRPKLAFIEQAGNRACVEGALRAQTMNHTTPSLLKQIGVCSANLNDLVESFADLHKQSPG